MPGGIAMRAIANHHIAEDRGKVGAGQGVDERVISDGRINHRMRATTSVVIVAKVQHQVAVAVLRGNPGDRRV